MFWPHLTTENLFVTCYIFPLSQLAFMWCIDVKNRTILIVLYLILHLLLSTNLCLWRRCLDCDIVAARKQQRCLLHTDRVTFDLCSAESSSAGDSQHNCSKIFTGIQIFSDGMQMQVSASLGWNVYWILPTELCSFHRGNFKHFRFILISKPGSC